MCFLYRTLLGFANFDFRTFLKSSCGVQVLVWLCQSEAQVGWCQRRSKTGRSSWLEHGMGQDFEQKLMELVHMLVIIGSTWFHLYCCDVSISWWICKLYISIPSHMKSSCLQNVYRGGSLLKLRCFEVQLLSRRSGVMNINVELLSGEACALQLQPDNTMREFKEKLKEACCWTDLLQNRIKTDNLISCAVYILLGGVEKWFGMRILRTSSC